MTVALLVLALVLGIMGAVRLRQRSDGGRVRQIERRDAGPATLSTSDLDDAFDRVLSAHGHELGDLLQMRLRGLVDRQVPVRAVRPAPGDHVARVCFADGTVVLARSAGTRDLTALVLGMQAGSVRITGFQREADVTRLALRGRTGTSLALLAIGLDQPD